GLGLRGGLPFLLGLVSAGADVLGAVGDVIAAGVFVGRAVHICILIEVRISVDVGVLIDISINVDVLVDVDIPIDIDVHIIVIDVAAMPVDVIIVVGYGGADGDTHAKADQAADHCAARLRWRGRRWGVNDDGIVRRYVDYLGIGRDDLHGLL